MRNKILHTVLGCVLVGQVAISQAAEPLPDKFRLSIGGYNTTRSDATLSVTDPNAGIGVSINPRDAFDLDLETTILRIEGHYQLYEHHALTFSWYNRQTSGEKTVESEIDWVDDDGNTITIPVGARLDSNLDTEIFKLGYLYSFYRSHKMDVSIGGGFHVSRVEVGLDANITNPPNSSINRVDSTLPLPVFSFLMNYDVTDSFGWYLKTEAFALKYEDWRGAYRDATLGAEYRAWRHVGLGLAITGNAL